MRWGGGEADEASGLRAGYSVGAEISGRSGARGNVPVPCSSISPLPVPARELRHPRGLRTLAPQERGEGTLALRAGGRGATGETGAGDMVIGGVGAFLPSVPSPLPPLISALLPFNFQHDPWCDKLFKDRPTTPCTAGNARVASPGSRHDEPQRDTPWPEAAGKRHRRVDEDDFRYRRAPPQDLQGANLLPQGPPKVARSSSMLRR